MKITLFLASGSSDGKTLLLREFEFVEKINKLGHKEDILVLFSKEIQDFDPPELFEKLFGKMLTKAGINWQALDNYGASSVSEILAAEKWIKKNSSHHDTIYLATSWFHLPRAWIVWLIHGKRTVRWFVVWDRPNALALILEPFKYPLIFLPESAQQKLGNLVLRFLQAIGARGKK